MHRYTVDTRIPFVGRGREVAHLTTLLDTKSHVTLTGAGGVGKSRLALEVAERWSRGNGGSVRFVALVGVAPEEVAGTVAAALGLAREPGRPALDVLEDAELPPRQTIVLDNCEDAPIMVRQVVERLGRHNDVRVLATSRVHLHSVNEVPFDVHPFDEREAMEFFEARARLANVTIDMDADGELVRSIVRQLDGLAVAIDLAAARLVSLSVLELANELSNLRPYHFRSSASREPRHRTINHVVDWSLSKLDSRTRQLFAVTGRFANLFSADDLAALGECTSLQAVQVLERLADQSLLVRVEAARIYTLLAPIRAVAKQRLSRLQSKRDVDKRFAQHMHTLGLQLTNAVELANAGNAMSAIAERYDDLVSTVDWTLQEPDDRMAATLGAFAALVTIWADGGRFGEGLTWCERYLQVCEGRDPDTRGRVYYGSLRVAHAAGAYERMLELGPQLISMFTIANNRLGLARAYNGLGVASLCIGHADEARTYVDTALALYRNVGHDLGVTTALLNQGNVALEGFNDPATARDLYTRALEIAERLGSDTNIALAQGNLAVAAHQRGDTGETEHRAQLALQRLTRAGNAARSAWMQHYLARASIARDDLPTAVQRLLAAFGLLEEQPNPDYLALCLEATATLLVAAGKVEPGAELLFATARLRNQRRIPAIGSALLDQNAERLRVQQLLTAEQLEHASRQADTMELRELASIARQALSTV